MQMYHIRFRLEGAFVALLLLACIKRIRSASYLPLPPIQDPLSSLVPCPTWDQAWYVNGKCFKLFDDVERSWTESLTFCPTQRSSRLAEPRTWEEVELLKSELFSGSRQVYLGAKMIGDSTPRFVSDDLKMNTFGFAVTNNWDQAGCIYTLGGGFHNTIHCESKFNHFAACEIQFETYNIPQAVASPGSFPRVLLEIVPTGSPSTTVLTLTWNVHHYNIADHHSDIVCAMTTEGSSTEVTTYRLDSMFPNVAKEYASYVVEMFASLRVTVTLVYEDDDHMYFRSLLHPLMAGNEDWVRYIVTCSGMTEYFMLSMVSKFKGNNSVYILFPSGDVPYSYGYITLDSIKAVNPSSLHLTIGHYQSSNIHGMMNLDGTMVTALRTLTVFLTLYRAKQSNPMDWADESPPLEIHNVHQALPQRSASHTYVTIPMTSSSTVNTTRYTAVAVYAHTTVKVENDVYVLQEPRFVREIILPVKPCMVTGDKPFLLYKAPSAQLTHNDSDSCLFAVVPETMWRKQYYISVNLTNKTEDLNLHLVFEREVREPLYNRWAIVFGIDQDVKWSEDCNDVTGNRNLTVCSMKVLLGRKSDMAIGPTPSRLKFAAYVSWWSVDGLHHCQPLGLDWYRGWMHTPPVEGDVTSSTTAMTTTAAASTPGTTSTGISSTVPTRSNTTPRTTIITTPEHSFPATTPPASPPPNPSTLNLTTCGHAVLPTNLSVEEIEYVLIDIRRLLRVDARKTSLYIRSKTSATDERQSSAGIGYTGIAVIVFALGSIILNDVIALTCRPVEVKVTGESAGNT